LARALAQPIRSAATTKRTVKLRPR
jgi:hypothetical protein